MKKIALVLVFIKTLEQLVLTLSFCDPCIVTGCNFFCAKSHRMVQKCLEFNFRIAQNIRIGRPSSDVFFQKLCKNAVLVISSEVDVLNFNAQNVSNRHRVNKIFVGRTVGVVVVVLPIFHEQSVHFVPLFF